MGSGRYFRITPGREIEAVATLAEVLRLRQGNSFIWAEEVNFFLGDRFLVSVHLHGAGESSFAAHFEATVRRDMEQARRGADFLL